MDERRPSFLSSLLSQLGDWAVFAARAFGRIFRPPLEIAETARQIQKVGFDSAPLIGLSGLAVGVVMSMHTRASLARFGAEAMIPTALTIAMIRETGPLVTALLVSGRVGAGIGAEIGGMRVTEQIDALESLAVDSMRYLVSTRLLALMIAMPILTTLFNFAAIFGGYLAETVLSGISFELYLQRGFSGIAFDEYIPATIKTVVFGFLISSISAWLGYNARGGAEGVGTASTQSVVASSVGLILVNVLLVKLIQFWFPGGGI
jgi:phospholipid/cholesterol/gamma-HCH transport system permease protein